MLGLDIRAPAGTENSRLGSKRRAGKGCTGFAIACVIAVHDNNPVPRIFALDRAQNSFGNALVSGDRLMTGFLLEAGAIWRSLLFLGN
jgi:hypothetical protein